MSNLIKPIFAQINNPVLPNSGSIVSSPSTYVNSVIQSVISIFLIVAVLYFVWHFIMYAYPVSYTHLTLPTNYAV